MMIGSGRRFNNDILPVLELLENIQKKINEWDKIVIVGRTHGQAASPTTFGKEINVFYERIKNQLNLLYKIPKKRNYARGNPSY